jgi:hypothetical protein
MSALRHQGPGSKAASLNFTIKPTYKPIYKINGVGQQAIVTAEANSSNWLAASWRPITMLTFLALVVGDTFGLFATPLRDEAWTLLQIGLGGYVVGRSGEKIAKVLKQ